jgi:hypothetical protein
MGLITCNEILKILDTNSFDPTWRTQAKVYLSLHTADPSAGDQLTAEATYDRVEVVKTAVGWTIVTNTSKNAAEVRFPKCTGAGGAQITHIAKGTVDKVTGAGQILSCGPLDDPLTVSNLVRPQFEALQLVTTAT